MLLCCYNRNQRILEPLLTYPYCTRLAPIISCLSFSFRAEDGSIIVILSMQKVRTVRTGSGVQPTPGSGRPVPCPDSIPLVIRLQFRHMVSRRLLVSLAPNRRAGAIKPTSLKRTNKDTWQAEKTVYPGFRIANTFPRSR